MDLSKKTKKELKDLLKEKKAALKLANANIAKEDKAANEAVRELEKVRDAKIRELDKQIKALDKQKQNIYNQHWKDEGIVNTKANEAYDDYNKVNNEIGQIERQIMLLKNGGSNTCCKQHCCLHKNQN